VCRGEVDYLVEWLEFRRMMRVEHLFRCDNALSPARRRSLSRDIQRLVPALRERLESDKPLKTKVPRADPANGPGD
jgi:hypothetical protein